MTSDPTSLSKNPFTLLSLIAAPAVLTNAASVLALSTSNRFVRASDRLRSLTARYDESNDPATRALLLEMLKRVQRQAAMLLNAMKAAYVAIGAFVTASLISILGAGVASSSTSLHDLFVVFAALALAVGVVGGGGIVSASVNLLGATRLALMNINEEAEAIVKRDAMVRGK
jgi:hypothetical protein